MQPLAADLRPETLDGFVGQVHLVGPGKPFRVAIEARRLFSFILWGPPGVGKTTLARIYAHAVDAEIIELSAVVAGKADVKKAIESVSDPTHPPVLFLDEVHRFTKAQQDFLLPYIERGDIIFIGATTENPSFRVNAALLSRLRVFVLKELTDTDIRTIVERTGLAIPEDAKDWIAKMANGDARQALNVVEAANTLYGEITVSSLQEALQNQYLRYDKQGEEHYNTISAFIKSMRAGSADAALYYLARMVQAGEDPLFIARRLVIFASEDIGLGQPTALVVANAVMQACQTIGYPECAINLAHGTAYLALAKKDRSANDAYLAALKDVEQFHNLPIPLSVRNAPTSLMKKEGYGKGYEMYPDDLTTYLPEKLKKRTYLHRKKPNKT